MQKLALIIIFFAISLDSAFSQESKVAFHIYNPVGLYQKAGGKFEYRVNHMGFLIGAIQYYGTSPSYPGTQLGLEWRHYSVPKAESRGENFFYTKFIAGHQEHMNSQGSGFLSVGEIPAGNYFGAGAGVGRHLNYGHFFIDLNGGLKYSISTVKQESAFYLSGPASYLDLHFNIGFQF